jgi:hypothetical protein
VENRAEAFANTPPTNQAAIRGELPPRHFVSEMLQPLCHGGEEKANRYGIAPRMLATSPG